MVAAAVWAMANEEQDDAFAVPGLAWSLLGYNDCATGAAEMKKEASDSEEEYNPWEMPANEASSGLHTTTSEASVLDRALAFGLQRYKNNGTLQECLGNCYEGVLG